VIDQTSPAVQTQEGEPRALATASSGTSSGASDSAIGAAANGAAPDGTAIPCGAQWATLAGHEHLLLGGPPVLSMREMAERAGTSLGLAMRFWRAMGFADVDPDEVRFTENDIDALRTMADLIDDTDDGLPSPAAPRGGPGAERARELDAADQLCHCISAVIQMVRGDRPTAPPGRAPSPPIRIPSMSSPSA